MSRLYTGIRAIGRGLAWCVLAPVQLAAFLAQAVAIIAACVGLIFLFPPIVERVRALAALARRLSAKWSAVPIDSPYRPEPEVAVRGTDERFHAPDGTAYPTRRTAVFGTRSRWVWTDPATWRDLLWMLTDPFVGGTLAAFPAFMIGAGLALLWWRPWSWPAALGVVNIVLGWVIAPTMVVLHGYWTRLLLAPASAAALARGERWRRRFGAGLLAVFRCLALGVLSPLAAPVLAVCFVSLVFTGPVVAMWVLAWARWLPNLFRRLGIDWSAADLPRPYLSTPRLDLVDRQDPRTSWWAGFAGQARAMWFDPATWRDLVWLACQPVAGLALLVPAGLVGYGIWGLVLPVLESPLGETVSPWYGEVAGSSWTAVLVGPLLVVFGLMLAPRLLLRHGDWLYILLRPTDRSRLVVERAQLAARVARLTETRTAATDTLTAELRRIERDLHDGAQARMVAVGMTLGAVEALIDRDPAAAKELVAQARTASAAALADLRGLVRGIHPPVLAERGLVDAVRALALDSPIEVRVKARLDAPVASPVESALYFTIAELLTNAARHSGADRVEVELTGHGTLLRISVRDNGCGGANPAAGTGLRGIEHRLSSFDGQVRLDSPPGGPTVVTVEIPLTAD
ncbi:histidine kinase [Nocardia sp. NPDC059240]|uniref:sensor histidine kinase n=1 Tax=Nocardia sp. NPDC059240 TaxID=3346786 RepID=UPI0036972305